MRRPITLLSSILLAWAGLSVVAPAVSADSGTFPVRASSDDAEQTSQGTRLSSSDLELLYDSTKQTVGLRFTGVTIAPGATINRAYVQFTAYRSASTPVAMEVSGQAAGNPATFTRSSTSISSRTPTLARVRWEPLAWSSGSRGEAERTPDLSGIVQEIVNRPDWASGNALVVMLTQKDTTTTKRVARGFDNGAAGAPALHVEWTTGSTSTDGTDPVAECSDGLDNDGDGTIDYPADVGCTSATDSDETDPVVPPRTPSGTGPTPADYGFFDCFAARDVVRPFPVGTVLTTRYRQSTPPDDTTYDLTGVFSTAQPSSEHPFSFGTGNNNLDAGKRTCFVGGELRDKFGDPPAETWEYYHSTFNASCVKGAAYGQYQILDTICRGIVDGFRPQEPGVNANNAQFAISDTYLGNVLDDCLENDYTVGGVVLDSLWERCYTGVSERPSSDRCWDTPPGEQLILDHLLLGLRPMAHRDGTTGYGRLFKWEKCTENTANQLVIKCSTFLVPETRLGGPDGMEIPAGTIVDDSACPNDPTTIVWLGGGSVYPGDLRGLPIRVVTDRSYWDAKVAAWKSAHGM